MKIINIFTFILILLWLSRPVLVGATINYAMKQFNMCLNFDIDKIKEDKFDKPMDELELKFQSGFVNTTIIKPMIHLQRKKGDISFFIMKKIAYWRI